MSKKYFWLKLKDNFFTDKKIKKLRKIAGGDTYTIIYLKMQLLSLKHDGMIIFDDLTSEFYEEIALELDEDEDNVKFTLMYLMNVGLVEEVDEKSIAMLETIDNIGRESESAKRVRALRQRQKESKKALQCNVTGVTGEVTDVTCNTELELELELEKDIKPSRSKYEICDMENAELLFQMMQDNNPNVKQPNLETWAKDMGLIRRIDNRTDEQIKYLINWTQKDDFWHKNILSPSKLRKQWDQLVLKVKEKPVNKQQQQLKPWEVEAYGQTTSGYDYVNDRSGISKPVPYKQLGIDL